MYSVHAVVFRTIDGNTTRHEVLIHDNMSPAIEQHLIDPKLKLADSSAGAFSATMTPYNPGYSLIERFNSIIKIHKGDRLIWTGRVLSESMDFWNRRSISCEGALAFLNDTVQPIAYYGTGRSPAYIIQTLLTIHNSKTVADRKLYLGTVSGFSDEEYNSNIIFQTNNGTTWEELKNNLLDIFDGHLTIHYTNEKAYLDFYEDYPNTAVQHINFGDNLLDFTRDWNLTTLATVILPRGATLDADTADGQKAYITLKSTTENNEAIEDGLYDIGDEEDAITVDGQYVISNRLYSQYGRVEKVVDFNDSTTASDLFILAKNYVSSMQFDEMTLTVSAVDLHALTKEIVSFELLDEVYCVSRPHGMYGKYFPITEIDIPLDKPEGTTYTMSSSSMRTGFTNNFGDFKNKTTAAFKKLSTTGHILDLARIEASSIINRKTTGYVSVINMFDNDEEGVAQAVVISNNPEWKKASKYWIWNMNGLAYYDSTRSKQIASSVIPPEDDESDPELPAYTEEDGNNFESPRYYDLAITMDGTIVANHIKAGILSDGMGYNYWNLETGEFSLQPNTRFQYGAGADQYQTVYDLVWRTDEAYNKRTGAANYLNGTKDWAEWRIGGSWHQENDDKEIMTCPQRSSVTWNDVLMSPKHNIKYATIKGYTMTFSIEGSINSNTAYEWGNITATNSLVISFSLVSSSGARLAKLDKAFSLEYDWSRRFVSVDMLDSSFTAESGGPYDYTNAYLDIWIYNRSLHGIHLRRPQFERGNTPTDWGISDTDIDKEAQLKATKAENNSKTYSEGYANNKFNTLEESTTKSFNNLEYYLKNGYKSAIEEGYKHFTKEELKTFDESMNQAGILDRLTNGGRNQGIYLENGRIYINAEYIKSGTLDAGLLKAGIIYAGESSIQRENNYWNLRTGILKTENSVFTNAEINGTFETRDESSNTAIVLHHGMIEGYGGGYVTRIGTSQHNMNGRRSGGFDIATSGDMVLGPHGDLYISSNGAYVEKAEDAYISVGYVTSVDGDGNTDMNLLEMTFTKGILTSWSDQRM